MRVRPSMVVFPAVAVSIQGVLTCCIGLALVLWLATTPVTVPAWFGGNERYRHFPGLIVGGRSLPSVSRLMASR
jgi:hypothetical protein